MTRQLHLGLGLLLWLCLGVGGSGTARGAEKLIIEAALDRQIVEPVLTAFATENPQIDLDYRDRSTLEVDHRARDSESPPDVVISSAMPWQLALSNDGMAQPLDAPEADQWSAWAKWRNEVFGFTFEPVVMAYRLELASHMPPPETHRDLLDLLTHYRQWLDGRVVSYSPRESGVGYTLFQQDARYTPRAWDLIAAMGAANVDLEATTQRMLEGLSDGRYWLGYNLLGSYAMVWAQSHPDIIVQVPNDYSLVMMRMAFVHRDAPHPAAARRFVSFLLSQRGQHILAGQTPLFSVRDDVVGPYTAQRLRDQVGDHLYPIPINATLLAFVDALRRQAFLRRWDRELQILEPSEQ
ncbi:ABC transporter substrate-binding protein [Salinicola acroporae]|uniref:ABC transporter substrate-binding protein n=1 Tax=Salinicola acroporae TaxID=1541440 RepID=A0ABT6I2S2_9GAMM|nr:ABC transporter substrate-binding protein [Salinicola acroporae]MDH4571982.1 ABC transporter substrate-binding protein [Salinicola acroporae]